MNNNYNYGYSNQPKKKKSKLGLIIIILFVAFQVIFALSALSDDSDNSTADNYDSGTNKNFDFPDYPDFNDYSSNNSSSNSSFNTNSSNSGSNRYDTSSVTSSNNTSSNLGNTSSSTSSYNTNSYFNNSSQNNTTNNNTNNNTNNGISGNNNNSSINFNGYLYNQLNNDEKTIYRTVVNTVANGGLKCSFSNVRNLTAFKQDVDDAITAVTYEFPELFWISGGWQYTYQKSGSAYNIKLELKCFDYWKYTSDPQKYVTSLRNAVTKIANKARAYETDFERVLYVHDYIAKTTEYNYDALKEKDKTVRKASTEQSFSAYGCLVDGNAICGGYSKGFQLVLKELGIECIYLTGYAGEYHAWNCIKLDGQYYYFDLTWDDPTLKNKSGKVMTDAVSYDYFGLTSKQMGQDHKILENFKFPTCVATLYNYYDFKGFVLDKYDFNKFDNILNQQSNQLVVKVKFTSVAELNKAKADLIDNYKWAKLKLFGGKTVQYNCNKDSLTFTFYRY